MTNELTQTQLEEMAESMIARRIENTGESREEAATHIANYLKSRMK